MRMVFGVLSLLLAVGIAGYIAKTQLKAVKVVPSVGNPSEEAPMATPAQQSQQLQRKVQDDVARALQQGVERAASSAP